MNFVTLTQMTNHVLTDLRLRGYTGAQAFAVIGASHYDASSHRPTRVGVFVYCQALHNVPDNALPHLPFFPQLLELFGQLTLCEADIVWFTDSLRGRQLLGLSKGRGEHIRGNYLSPLTAAQFLRATCMYSEYRETTDRNSQLLSVEVALSPGLYPGSGLYAGPGFYPKSYGSICYRPSVPLSVR